MDDYRISAETKRRIATLRKKNPNFGTRVEPEAPKEAVFSLGFKPSKREQKLIDFYSQKITEAEQMSDNTEAAFYRKQLETVHKGCVAVRKIIDVKKGAK